MKKQVELVDPPSPVEKSQQEEDENYDEDFHQDEQQEEEEPKQEEVIQGGNQNNDSGGGSNKGSQAGSNKGGSKGGMSNNGSKGGMSNNGSKGGGSKGGTQKVDQNSKSQSQKQQQMERSQPLEKSKLMEKNLERLNSLTAKLIPQREESRQNSRKSEMKVTRSVLPVNQFKQFIPGSWSSMINSHAEQDIKTMIERLCMNGEFSDADFGVDKEKTLLGRDWQVLSESEQSERRKFINELYDKIELLPMEETVEEAHKLQFCDRSDGDKFYVKSLVQGYLKDREFLNGLALICSESRLFEQLCYVDQSVYVFRMFKNKSQRYSIAVDSKIPALVHESGIPTACFSRTEIANEVWVSLIEKAYAKLNGGYYALQGVSLRDAVCDLIGLEPEIVMIDRTENVNETNMKEYLRLLRTNGSIVGLMQRSEVQMQVSAKLKAQNKLDNTPQLDRMYILREVKCDDKQVYSFIVYDPWFQGGCLMPTESKGVYELSWGSLVSVFNCVVIVKDFPDEWRGLRMDINLNPCYGIPSSGNVGWVQNPQYLIQVGLGVPGDMQDVPFVLRLNELKGVQEVKEYQCGMTLWKVGEKEDKVKTFNQNNLLFMTRPGGTFSFGSRVRDNYSYCVNRLGKKYYVVSPFSNQKGETQQLYLQLEIYFSGKPSQLNFKFPTQSILNYCVGEPDQSEPRILRDRINMVQLQQQYNQFDQMALVPGMGKQIILINPNVNYGNNLVTAEDKTVLDPKLQYLQDNIVQEQLLGLDLKYPIQAQGLIDSVSKEMESIQDFSNYKLQDDGLKCVMQYIVEQSSVIELRLSGNDLSDESVLLICYEMEKSYHQELEVLDLSNNKVSKVDTLLTFIDKMKKLRTIDLNGNQGISQVQINRVNQKLMNKK